jgi:hypothetical protein
MGCTDARNETVALEALENATEIPAVERKLAREL